MFSFVLDAHIDSGKWTIKMIIFTIICAMRSPYTCTVKCAKREGHIEITEKWSNSIEIAENYFASKKPTKNWNFDAG